MAKCQALSGSVEVVRQRELLVDRSKVNATQPNNDQSQIFSAALLLLNRVQTTMNPQGQASGGGGGGFLPAPRQDMEYICAGVFVASPHIFNFTQTRQIVALRMRSNQGSQYVVESVDIVSCTRSELKGVRYVAQGT